MDADAVIFNDPEGVRLSKYVSFLHYIFNNILFSVIYDVQIFL